MSDINVQQDLEQINQQLEQLVGQLNTLNGQRDQLTQQIHNLNGIAMYLRGKQENDSPDSPMETNNHVANLEEIPETVKEKK